VAVGVLTMIALAFAVGACMVLADLAEHTVTDGALADGSTDANENLSDGAAGDAGAPRLEIAVTPSALAVLPGDIVDIEVRLVARPSGAVVTLRAEGASIVTPTSDGGFATVAAPAIAATADRMSILVATPSTGGGGGPSVSVKITATVDLPLTLTDARTLTLTTTRVDTAFGVGGYAVRNLDKQKTIDDYLVAVDRVRGSGSFSAARGSKRASRSCAA
jgi:hypothetical protein